MGNKMSSEEKRYLKKYMWSRSVSNKKCREWTGPLDNTGYARFQYKKIRYLIHRASYEITHGPIPKGAYILHKCHNRKCIYAEHLYAGSHKENMIDMVKAGRSCSGNDTWMRKYPERVKRGQDNPMSKITENQAIMVIELYKIMRSCNQISIITKIHRKCISDIINGKSWRHLNEDS